MVNTDDYYCGLTQEEYEMASKEQNDFLEHLSKVNSSKASQIVDKYKDNLFVSEFVSDEEAEMLYHTIINWRDKADMYDDEEGV